MKKSLLAIAFSCLFSQFAVAGAVLTAPQTTTFELHRNDMYEPGIIATGFRKFSDGSFGLLVEVEYVSTFQARYAFRNLSFAGDSDKFFAVGNDLYFRDANLGDVKVGHHAWWYSPSWQLVDGVAIETKLRKVKGDIYTVTARLVLK